MAELCPRQIVKLGERPPLCVVLKGSTPGAAGEGAWARPPASHARAAFVSGQMPSRADRGRVLCGGGSGPKHMDVAYNGNEVKMTTAKVFTLYCSFNSNCLFYAPSSRPSRELCQAPAPAPAPLPVPMTQARSEVAAALLARFGLAGGELALPMRCRANALTEQGMRDPLPAAVLAALPADLADAL